MRKPDENRQKVEKLGGSILKFEYTGLARGFLGGFLWLGDGRGRARNFRHLMQLNNAGVGNFPTKGLYLALLLITLFQEDGLPRIGSQISRGWQDDISGAVCHHDALAQEI